MFVNALGHCPFLLFMGEAQVVAALNVELVETVARHTWGNHCYLPWGLPRAAGRLWVQVAMCQTDLWVAVSVYFQSN